MAATKKGGLRQFTDALAAVWREMKYKVIFYFLDTGLSKERRTRRAHEDQVLRQVFERTSRLLCAMQQMSPDRLRAARASLTTTAIFAEAITADTITADTIGADKIFVPPHRGIK